MADAFPKISALDMIKQVLKTVGVLGVGQSPSSTDVDDVLFQLNMMLAEWNSQRWIVYRLEDLSCVANGNETYTIGPTSDFSCALRPDRIESAFCRQITQPAPNQPDWGLQLIQSWSDYQQIALKKQTSSPDYLFYDPAYPRGELHFWPVPLPEIYELHVQVKEQFTGFTDLTTKFSFPPNYYATVFHNLVLRAAGIFGRDPPQVSVKFAQIGMNNLRKANTQLGRLRMPLVLVRPGIYDPYSDRVR